MRVFSYFASAAAIAFAVAASPASAASFDYHVATVGAGVNPFVGDLTNATASTTTGDGKAIYDPDFVNGSETINFNLVGFASFPGAGLDGAVDDIHIKRSVTGVTGGMTFEDRYLFNYASAPAGAHGSGHATVHVAIAQNSALSAATFRVFADTNGDGVADPGEEASNAIVFSGLSASAGGSLVLPTLASGTTYLLQVMGTIASGVSSGGYMFSFKTVVPVPPAIILLLTALGALYGVSRLRRVPAPA